MRAVGAGAAGGMLAGALVGAAEALAVWRFGDAALPPIAWAVVAYAAVGALLGVVAAGLARLAGTGGFGTALGTVGLVLALVVARFRVAHDVLPDGVPAGAWPALAQLGVLAWGAGAAAVVVRALRTVEARRGLVTRPAVALGLVAAVALGWTLVSSPRPGAAAATGGPTTAPANADAPNVVLVVVDGLRADHVGRGPGGRTPTPRLDALAGDGTRYTRAYAAAGSPGPALASLLTGLPPSAHGAVGAAGRLSERVETVAEMLARGGYRTAAFVTAPEAAPASGLDRGFAEYRYLPPSRLLGADEDAATLALYAGLQVARDRLLARPLRPETYRHPASAVADRVEAWLGAAAGTSPFFLFVQLSDAREPFVGASGAGYGRIASPTPDPSASDAIRAAYAAQVAALDREIGRILAALGRSNAYGDTVVIVTGARGSAFDDRGPWWRRPALYEEDVAVPLIVKPARDGARGAVVDDLVAGVDVAPTVLRATGMVPPARMTGQALPLDGGRVAARDGIEAEEHRHDRVLRMFRTPEWKLVTTSPSAPGPARHDELFRMDRHAPETENLAANEPVRRDELLATLGRRTLAARALVAADAPADGVAPGTEDRLKALGYVE